MNPHFLYITRCDYKFELVLIFCIYSTGGERHESEAGSKSNQCIRDTENVQSGVLQEDRGNSLYPDVDSHGQSAGVTARAEVLERCREGIWETENPRDLDAECRKLLNGGVLYINFTGLPTTFKIVCWPFDNAFFWFIYTNIAWFLFLVCNVFVLIKYFVASYYNFEFHYFDFVKKRWPRYRIALSIR